MTILEVNNIYKSFGGVKALSGVSFRVESGELVGLVGPNGAGKTTLFNVISGVYKPDNGQVIFKDINITRLPIHKIRKLGLSRTFQIIRLFDGMSVIDNVALPLLYINDMSKDEAKEVADKWVSFVGLYDKRNILIEELTFQEKRRVELARALVTYPKLLLIDEIAAGLTPGELIEVEEIVSKLNKEFNITIIWVEHHFRSVAKICSRIIFLDRGKILADERPEEIIKISDVIKTYVGEEL